MSDDRGANLKLLIDEDLSPLVAQRLCQDGIDTVSVRDRAKLGAPDHEVMEYAYQEERIVVTANVRDFRQLAAARDLYPGLVFVLDGGLLRDEQVAVVRKAVAAIQTEFTAGRDMVNRTLCISLLDGTQRFDDLPDPEEPG